MCGLATGCGHELKLMITLRKEGKAKSLQINSCKARLWRACLLSRGSKDNHVRNLARGILKDGACPERSRRDAVVLFTKIEEIPPTNNVAERSLRSLVISRVISFGNHWESGLTTTARLRTIAATAKNQGIKVWDYLTNAFVQHRSGLPVSLLPCPPGIKRSGATTRVPVAAARITRNAVGSDLSPFIHIINSGVAR